MIYSSERKQDNAEAGAWDVMINALSVNSRQCLTMAIHLLCEYTGRSAVL